MQLGRMMLVAGLVLPVVATAARAQERPPDERGTFTLLIENDALDSSDRHYTNGLKLAWLSSEKIPDWLRAAGDWLPFFSPNSRRRYGFSIGQSIFTPEDKETAALITDDRPYAGWLYAGFAMTADSGNQLDTFELNLGVVGPSAKGEQLQNGFHRAIGSDQANGWDNQLHDEFGAVLYYEHKWRGLLETSRGGFGVDVTPHVGGALGNVYTYAAGGATLRFGQDLPSDYGPPRVRPALAGTGFFNPSAGFGWYLFAGAEGRAVARDIFLDGNTTGDDSHSVDKKPFVADLQAGIAITIQSVRLAFTQVYRTKEFDGQDGENMFGALSLSVRW
jgi:lipid A 3-O-deacylase